VLILLALNFSVQLSVADLPNWSFPFEWVI